MTGISRRFSKSAQTCLTFFLSLSMLLLGVGCNHDDAATQDPSDTVNAERRAPTVTLTANPTTVAAGAAATLTWTTSAAHSCQATGAWSGSMATSGSQSTGPLAATAMFILTCTGQFGSAADTATVAVTPADTTPPPPAPTVSLSANPTSVASGGTSTLTWSSTDATGCTAGGAWSGAKGVSGSEQTTALSATSTFTLSCSGAGGTASQSKTVTVTTSTPAPTVSLSANPTSVASGGTSTLSWSSTNATGCTASGAWSGAKAMSGSEQTAALSATSTFTLSCTGASGTASQSKTVTVSTSSGGSTGLSFPSNGTTSADVRFRFTGANLQPMYPATYIWKVNPRQQAGYYTTFFWGPDGAFTGTSYYGAHPYPDGEPKPSSTAHHWELSIDGGDNVTDANGHSTAVAYDAWRTQALRVFDNGTNKVHEFYWDLPDTTKVIRVLLDRAYGSTAPANPGLNFGDAPWNQGNERLSGILRGLQLYNVALSPANIVAESGTPLSTTAGSGGIWYLNLNPTPDDITDKSGKGHNPAWVSSTHAALWTGQ
jgi:hypothetical protein